MAVIWKFILQPKVTLPLPQGAELLTVAAQGEEICLWAKVDPAAPKEDRKFHIYGTGHPIPDNLNLRFLGTAFLDRGTLVFHAFEEIEA